jgi:AcrR family transcriptional regulator
MASPAPLKSPNLQPEHWILAAFARLSAEGIDAVRIEVLARELRVSKGSFYWHFQDREELVEKMLARWESEEFGWLDSISAAGHGPAARWARFVERYSEPDRARLLVGIHSWARRDAAVAARITALEARRARFIAEVLVDIGLPHAAADSWSELTQYAWLGWLDRDTREAALPSGSRSLADVLSELIRAASAQSAASR